MNTQHTPGPWHLEDSDGIIENAQGVAVADIAPRVAGPIPSEAEAAANGALIAAAPAMLAALQALLPLAEAEREACASPSTEGEEQWLATIDGRLSAARAAIAAATGTPTGEPAHPIPAGPLPLAIPVENDPATLLIRDVLAVCDMSDPENENFADSAADCLDALLQLEPAMRALVGEC